MSADKQLHFDPHVLTIADLKKAAGRHATPVNSDYFNEGAGDLYTVAENEDAYRRYMLRPRILRDVKDLDMSTTLFGVPVAAPLGFSPAAAHKLAHPDGEIGTSRAAAANNIPMCLSSWSTCSLEDVIAESSGNPYAMQVTFVKDYSITEMIIKRAEAAGYKAIFVSVDLPVIGSRLNEARNNFQHPLEATLPNLNFPDGRQVPDDSYTYDPSISWEKNIAWLRQQTNMKIWLKGVYTAEDVKLAIKHNLDGVLISNHGGRQLDGVPATLDSLRECAEVAKGKIPIGVDGGIRRGSDIFKAIALGADFCFVGRIPVWGLAYKGWAGVDLAIKILLKELQQTMMLCGCRTIADIKRDYVAMLGPNGTLAKL
ncbi:(S)-2-hydroxy-acid oxidase [Fusarium keratoplasticum]|nr:(S)-2-hydroxy-acid oxidase [Fusarium keratoplasticum]